MNDKQPTLSRVGRASNFIQKLRGFSHDVVLSASGADRKLLAERGTGRCWANQEAIGSLIVVASLMAFVTIGSKAWSLTSGLTALIMFAFAGAVAAGATFNIERLVTATMKPMWPLGKKIRAILTRGAVSCVLASAQTVPTVWLLLDSSVANERYRIELAERAQSKTKLEDIRGLKKSTEAVAQADAAARNAAQQVHVLPESVIDQFGLAAGCDKQAETTLALNRKKAATLNSRLPALANIELSHSSTPEQKAAATKQRDGINAQIAKLADEVKTKRTECTTSRAQAEEGKRRYIADATAREISTQGELQQKKDALGRVETDLSVDLKRAEEVARQGNGVQFAAEWKALWSLIERETYAKLVLVLIWVGYFLWDLTSVAMKAMLEPTPYDFAMCERDELARTTAEKTIRDAQCDDAEHEAASRAKLRGITTFHQTDAGAVFARLEQLRFDEQVRTTETAQDIRIARAQVNEINALGSVVEETIKRVNGNHALVARLNEVLAILRGPATSGTAV